MGVTKIQATCVWCGQFTGFLTPKQAAQICQVPVQTFRRWIRDGRIDGAHKVNIEGRLFWRIPATSIYGLIPGGNRGRNH